eukprot:262490-Heterocapsa_arctica.AAC.1
MLWEAPRPVAGSASRGRSAPMTGPRSLIGRFDKHDLFGNNPFEEVASSSMSRATPTRAPRSRSPSLKRSTRTLTSQERQTPCHATNVAPVGPPLHTVGPDTGSTASV